MSERRVNVRLQAIGADGVKRELADVGASGEASLSRIGNGAKEAGEAKGLAHSLAEGSACASEAFFPFADGLLEAVAAGATAVIQPGGSIRDDEVIAAADERGIAMAFTGVRVFRH